MISPDFILWWPRSGVALPQDLAVERTGDVGEIWLALTVVLGGVLRDGGSGAILVSSASGIWKSLERSTRDGVGPWWGASGGGVVQSSMLFCW